MDSYTRRHKTWSDKNEKLETPKRMLESGGLIDLPAGKKIVADLAAHLTLEPRHVALSHRALLKIAVWSNIRRFKPGSKEQEEADTPLEQCIGFRIHAISKSAGVFYYGVEDRAERAKRKVCLKGFMKEKQTVYGVKKDMERRRNALAPYLAIGALAAMAVPAYSAVKSWTGVPGEYLGEALVGLAENVRDGFGGAWVTG